MGGMVQVEEEDPIIRGFTSGRVGASESRSSSLRQSMFSKLGDSKDSACEVESIHHAHTHTHIRREREIKR